MRARLPAALSVVYDYDVDRAMAECPGEQRQHVFDFEEGIRCVISIDRDRDGILGRPFLHLSFSCDWSKTEQIGHFLRRIEMIPVEFWPDTVLLELKHFMTPCAVHFIYEVPLDWQRFLKACESIPKTGSSAP